MSNPNEEANKAPVPMARIDKNIRELAGKPAIDLVADRMQDDLVETQIPFQVDALGMDENGYLYADVRMAVVVRVIVEKPEEPEDDDEIQERYDPEKPLVVDEDEFIHNTKKD